MSLGPWEIVLIFLVVIILFGGAKIPEIARSLGKGLREFKKTTKDIQDEVTNIKEDVKKTVDNTEKYFLPLCILFKKHLFDIYHKSDERNCIII